MPFLFDKGLKQVQTRVLKSSSKYLIYSCEIDGKKYVCKIAHKNPDQLKGEAARIRDLSAAYPEINNRLPNIVEEGIVSTGIHAGKAFYIQEFVAGDTFSHFLQDASNLNSGIDKVVRTVFKVLSDIVLEHENDSQYDGRSGSFLRDAVLEEMDNFGSLSHIAQLGTRGVSINGKSYAPLSEMVEKIFSSQLFELVEGGSSCISKLGHWNFHGDNILMESAERVSELSVIDPDTKIEIGDPIFGLARFLYTFPHDTADYEQYVIHSHAITNTFLNADEFQITYLWPQVVYERYAALYEVFSKDSAYALSAWDERLADARVQARLKLNKLFCLLRGVNANYKDEIEFVNGDGSKFRHKGIYLYLQACMFANKLVEEQREKIAYVSEAEKQLS